MLFNAFAAVALAAFALAQPTAQKPFKITSPSKIAQCSPALFQWTPTTAPYYISIYRSGDGAEFAPEDKPIKIPNANSAAWIVDYPAGTSIRLYVRDATGEITATMPMVVGEGSTDCMEEVEEDQYVDVEDEVDVKEL